MSEQEIKNAVCRAVQDMPNRDKIKRVRLFGSYLHGQAQEQSDIDLLVDFDEKTPVGYFEIVRIQDAFEKELGKKVDVVTLRALSKHFRDEVLKEAQLLYEQGSSSGESHSRSN